jgi:hypothetical protein
MYRRDDAQVRYEVRHAANVLRQKAVPSIEQAAAIMSLAFIELVTRWSEPALFRRSIPRGTVPHDKSDRRYIHFEAKIRSLPGVSTRQTNDKHHVFRSFPTFVEQATTLRTAAC